MLAVETLRLLTQPHTASYAALGRQTADESSVLTVKY